MVPPPRRPSRYYVLYLGDYHICDGRVSKLMESIQVAQSGGFDLMILMETNITDNDYF